MIKDINNGIFYMLASSFLGAVNGAIAKTLASSIPALEIVFFRNMLGVIIILAMLKHTPSHIDRKNLPFLVLRGFFGFVAMFLFFYTITVIPLGDAITLNKTSPIFVAILAFLILHERLNILNILGVLLGFIGVILIAKPNGFELDFAYLLGILGGFFAAAAYTTINKIKHIYDSRVIVLSFMGMGTIMPLLLFMIAPHMDNPLIKEFILPNDIKSYLLIGLMALTATASQWLLTKAYSSPSISLVATISYSIIPFAVFFGVLLGDKVPDAMTIVGIVFIIIAGILAKK